MGRTPVVKCTLDIFSCVDENGVRTGSYGARLLNGSQLVEIPADFKPVLVAGSLNGDAGSGAVEGALFLKYGGDISPIPAHLAEYHGKAVHAVKWSGPNGVTVSMDFLIALADSMLPVELYSKRYLEVNGPVADPTSSTDPYADADNDGILNWRDPNWLDGPGWEQPDGPAVPEEPVDPGDSDGPPPTPPGHQPPIQAPGLLKERPKDKGDKA